MKAAIGAAVGHAVVGPQKVQVRGEEWRKALADVGMPDRAPG